MQTRVAFALWPRLHQDLLRFLDRVPAGVLETSLAAGAASLGTQFRHVAAVEDYWRRVVLEREADYREIAAAECPDPSTLRQRLVDTFAATEQLLAGSLVEALAERPVRTRYPVNNALEALSLAQIHTTHHRAGIAQGLRSLGVDPEDWI